MLGVGVLLTPALFIKIMLTFLFTAANPKSEKKLLQFIKVERDSFTVGHNSLMDKGKQIAVELETEFSSFLNANY